MQSFKPDDKHIVTMPANLLDGESRTVLNDDAVVLFNVYLCPDCSNVHISIASTALSSMAIQFNGYLEPDDAAKLANLLLHPSIPGSMKSS